MPKQTSKNPAAISLWVSALTPFAGLLALALALHLGWLAQTCYSSGLDCLETDLANVTRVIEYVWLPMVLVGTAGAAFFAFKAFRRKAKTVKMAVVMVAVSAGASVALLYMYFKISNS